VKVNEKKLDDLWALRVKEKAEFKCEYCGKEEGLNSHHIFSRSNHSVRWYIPNGLCLCVSHHVFGNFSAHKSPMDFSDWIKEYRGEEWYDELKRKKNESYKPDYEVVLESLN
jgi:hypothetical protein